MGYVWQCRPGEPHNLAYMSWFRAADRRAGLYAKVSLPMSPEELATCHSKISETKELLTQMEQRVSVIEEETTRCSPRLDCSYA